MNKVFIMGLVAAVLTAVIQSIQAEHISWYSVAFGGTIAFVSYLTRNLQGQWISILGIFLSAMINFFTAHPEPTGITLEYVAKSWVLPLVLQVVLAFAGPKSEEPTA
jgi:hypothetical protein